MFLRAAFAQDPNSAPFAIDVIEIEACNFAPPEREVEEQSDQRRVPGGSRRIGDGKVFGLALRRSLQLHEATCDEKLR